MSVHDDPNYVTVRMPRDFPLALIAILGNRHGYSLKWIQPEDMRRHARNYEVVPWSSQYSNPETKPWAEEPIYDCNTNTA